MKNMRKPNALAGNVDGFKSGVLFIDDTLACNNAMAQADSMMALVDFEPKPVHRCLNTQNGRTVGMDN